MGERLSSLFPVLLLIVLAAMTYWLDRAVQTSTTTPKDVIKHDPDYIVDKLLATRMDLSGHIRDTLYAVRMTHFADDDSTELEQPRFISHGHGAPLSITANKGLISSNGSNLYFRGDVRATRGPLDNKNELVVSTEYLHLMPDDNIAKTDQPVVITDGRMTLKAAAMELNSETRVLKLNGNVRGEFVDAKSNASRAHVGR